MWMYLMQTYLISKHLYAYRLFHLDISFWRVGWVYDLKCPRSSNDYRMASTHNGPKRDKLALYNSLMWLINSSRKCIKSFYKTYAMELYACFTIHNFDLTYQNNTHNLSWMPSNWEQLKLQI